MNVAVAPETTNVKFATGAILLTLNATADEVAVLPAASKALAVSVWAPLAIVLESKVIA